MRGLFKRKFLAIFLAFVFIFPIIPAEAASPETRAQLRELERQRQAAGQLVSEQQNLLAGTEFEMAQIVTEMMELDQQITDVQEALEAIELDLLATEIRIADAEEDLAIAREERDVQTEILRERLRVMHEQGSVGMLEVLFQAESISDFFLRWEYVRAVAQFDRDLLERLEDSESRVASNLEDLGRSRILIRELQAQEILAKQAIGQRMEEREIFFQVLYADAERQAEYAAILEEERRSIDLEFGRIQQIYRAEAAEAARIAREEEDRRRAEQAAARAAEQVAALAELGSLGNFAWPLAIRGTLTSEFGNRPDPFSGRTVFHEGIDVAAPAGTRILAAEAGIVRFAGWAAGFGNYIILDHADGYSTLYAHNSRNRVSVGERVTQGQHIGDVGTTGRSTGNHLHFEIRRNGNLVNPMLFFG
ncbi:MAG: peptidoglycan DD-metalloendopeptidase family protein [Defluviitaleaceae bacterium]|nr:peptidoglycan DD-metalloendopeptidase family protein [Defluviitaleaceae bacterium]